MSKPKKQTRGGKREGAGRKPKGKEALKTCSLAMSAEAWNKATTQAENAGIARGEWVQELIMQSPAGLNEVCAKWQQIHKIHRDIIQEQQAEIASLKAKLIKRKK